MEGPEAPPGPPVAKRVARCDVCGVTAGTVKDANIKRRVLEKLDHASASVGLTLSWPGKSVYGAAFLRLAHEPWLACPEGMGFCTWCLQKGEVYIARYVILWAER